MSILIQFLAVNVMISAQILFKTSLKFSKHWNLNKIFIKPQQGFCYFDKEPFSTRSCLDQSCPHLALPHLTLPYLAPPCLITYPILKSLIVSHHIKMCLVLWQLTIWYDYLTHLDQLLFSFLISFHFIQLSSCSVLFHCCLVWFYSFTEAQPSKEETTVMMPNHILRNLIEASI